jgi:mannosyltransferase
LGGRAEDAVTYGVRRLAAAFALLAVLAVAAYLRFDGLHTPSYWLDEILYDQLTTELSQGPWWQWLTTSHAEHAGLYYFTQLIVPGRVAAAIFGLATVVLVFLIARIIEPRAAIPAAIVLAVSPLHVYYSREARSYALLMLLTAALILILVKARSLAGLIAVLLAMLYTAALSAPVIVAAFAVAVACALLTRNRWYWYAAAACAAVLPLFRLLYTAKPYEGAGWPSFPPLGAKLLDTLLRTFTLSALGTGGRGWVGVVVLLFAVVGAVLIARRNRLAAVVVIGMTVLPFAAAMASLKVFDHFFAGRYVTPALIGFVILIAAGISRFEIAGVVLAIGVATQTWTAARTEPLQKLDWRAIAQTIWMNGKPGELVVAAEPWSEVSLRYYLSRLPKRVQLVHIYDPEVANVQRQIRPGSWLVTAGFSANPAVRQWMCRYPLLLASPLEAFRLHYASRAIDGNAPFFFGEGWADPEGSLRWAVAKKATVIIPRWSTHDEVISMRLMPMWHPSLPLQSIRVLLNGQSIGGAMLRPGWSDHSFQAPGRFWIKGANTLTFEFDYAIPPAALDPKATDRRPLAVSFENLRLGAPLTRITALLEKREEETRFPPALLNREAVRRLIARHGFDPNVVWPRLANGELRLDDVAETLTWDQDCGGDLRKVFEVLLGREPSPHELRELGALPRDRAIGRILKWDEFRLGVRRP